MCQDITGTGQIYGLLFNNTMDMFDSQIFGKGNSAENINQEMKSVALYPKPKRML